MTATCTYSPSVSVEDEAADQPAWAVSIERGEDGPTTFRDERGEPLVALAVTKEELTLPLILPARPQPHRQGVNRTLGSPIDFYAYIDEEDEGWFTSGSRRFTPDQVHRVHANLSLAKMGFWSHKAHADPIIAARDARRLGPAPVIAPPRRHLPSVHLARGQACR